MGAFLVFRSLDRWQIVADEFIVPGDAIRTEAYVPGHPARRRRVSPSEAFDAARVAEAAVAAAAADSARLAAIDLPPAPLGVCPQVSVARLLAAARWQAAAVSLNKVGVRVPVASAPRSARRRPPH